MGSGKAGFVLGCASGILGLILMLVVAPADPTWFDRAAKPKAEMADGTERIRQLQEEKEKILELRSRIISALEAATFSGKASFYAEPYHGRATASGSIYNKYEFTAASEWLPMGSKWVIQSNATGRMVVVEITDRFPSTKGRMIDLSEAAFRAIAPLEKGVIAVTMWPFIGKGEE